MNDIQQGSTNSQNSLTSPRFPPGIANHFTRTRSMGLPVLLAILFVAPIAFLSPVAAVSAAKIHFEPRPLFQLETSVESRDVSRESLQLGGIIDVLQPLQRVQALHAKQSSSSELSSAERQELTELRLDIMEKIEQTRLDIDSVIAEIDEEMAGGREIYEVYSNQRDNLINRANAYAFRTNGVLWAIAEALDIPTYSHPRYSISSGTIGILAGLVPTAFSLYALHSESGRHYQRQPYPNMLCKLLGQPVVIRNDFPASVWKFLTAIPDGETKSRKDMMIDYWLKDANIKCFKDATNKAEVEVITGVRQPSITIQLMNDRLTMLGELKSEVLHMTRPLLELQMVERGLKQLKD